MLVEHVDDVERLAVAPEPADVRQHLLDSPVLLDRDVVGSHQTTDRRLGITEEVARDAPLFRREEVQQIARHLRGQFLEKRRAIVGRHVVEDVGDFDVAHRFEQLFLRFDRQILERRRRGLARQQPEDDRLILGRELDDGVGKVGDVELHELLAQLDELPLTDELREAIEAPLLLLPLELLAFDVEYVRHGRSVTSNALRAEAGGERR